MTQKKIKIVLLLGVAVGALVGCGDGRTPAEQARWAGTDNPNVARGEFRTTMHGVGFAPGSPMLAGVEQTRLSDYVRTIKAGDDVVVAVAPGGGALPTQRAIVVRHALEAAGVRVARVGATNDVQLGADVVLVSAGRWVAVKPDCKQWSQAPGPNFSNAPLSHLNCANETNLGAMIADPKDLAVGRSPGPASGERFGAAVDRYLTNKVKPLPKENNGMVPAETSGGSGAAPAGGNGGN
jgi:pilus assembly protein CpaD